MTKLIEGEDFSLYDAFKNHLDSLNYEGYTEQIAGDAPRLFAYEWESFRKNYHFKIKELTVTNFAQGKKRVPGFRMQGSFLARYGFHMGDVVKVSSCPDGLIISK